MTGTVTLVEATVTSQCLYHQVDKMFREVQVADWFLTFNVNEKKVNTNTNDAKRVSFGTVSEQLIPKIGNKVFRNINEDRAYMDQAKPQKKPYMRNHFSNKNPPEDLFPQCEWHQRFVQEKRLLSNWKWGKFKLKIIKDKFTGMFSMNEGRIIILVVQNGLKAYKTMENSSELIKVEGMSEDYKWSIAGNSNNVIVVQVWDRKNGKKLCRIPEDIKALSIHPCLPIFFYVPKPFQGMVKIVSFDAQKKCTLWETAPSVLPTSNISVHLTLELILTLNGYLQRSRFDSQDHVKHPEPNYGVFCFAIVHQSPRACKGPVLPFLNLRRQTAPSSTPLAPVLRIYGRVISENRTLAQDSQGSDDGFRSLQHLDPIAPGSPSLTSHTYSDITVSQRLPNNSVDNFSLSTE
ncbi:hypothetical protein AAG570_010903 [Ranatra chinensis]|uniref:Uncharacterized protein n=1 Tax=Ranatra chinensis TaxID=642074 RepID=A0ABD0YJ21_9HEMI